MKKRLFIIHSEYVAHGRTFNSENRYTDDFQKANKIYEEVLEKMKTDNQELLEDKSNYEINQANRKFDKFFFCYYKYQSGTSNFYVSMETKELE